MNIVLHYFPVCVACDFDQKGEDVDASLCVPFHSVSHEGRSFGK